MIFSERQLRAHKMGIYFANKIVVKVENCLAAKTRTTESPRHRELHFPQDHPENAKIADFCA